MKIAVHAQVLTAPKLFGIGYHLYHLLSAMGRTDQPHAFSLLSGRPILHVPPGSSFSSIVKPKNIPNKCFSYLGFPWMASKEKCDLAFFPKEVTSFGLAMPMVTTAYDLYSLKLPKELRGEFFLSSKIQYQLAKWVHFKRASKILAISEDTKSDLINLCGIAEEKIVVTPLGADSAFFTQLSAEKKAGMLQKFGIEAPFLLNTSSYWWGRKNLLRLIQAFANAKRKLSLPHELVITGKPGPSLRKMQELIHKENLCSAVKLLNYVEKEEVIGLMQSAAAMVFPSLHEGFGLPILEAMAAGCPVVTSNSSAMKEVGGHDAFLVDPLETDSIEEGIEKVLMDTELRQKLIRGGKDRAQIFTWENTARKTLDVFSRF
jgi:glycosyltransferase involved in cell wall biosynthesis